MTSSPTPQGGEAAKNRLVEGGKILEKRKPLTRAEALELAIRQAGQCGCGCAGKLDPMGEGVIDEHVRALGLLGTNALANRALYRTPCASKKTTGSDIPRIAKAKRQGGETGQKARRDKRGGSMIPAAKGPIPSRGFDKTKTRTFSGKVVPR